ncbi:IDEAL domain-containing protein [Ornithinibacillus salinisoli]|uniref:IDEAL domain-containing protein n=1 Tax=Ornithinibacillus salinisoli TaxID=1848459 RepID=A0ABW4W4S6_9BACI
MKDDWLRQMFIESLVEQMFKSKINNKPMSYEEMEYNCKTSITDEDMLRIQIDYALDTGNKELFMRLTQQLKCEV